MKRRILLCIISVTIIGSCVWLSQDALAPADYAGVWYGAEDGFLYIFEDGIIECSERFLPMRDNTVISGAYAYSKEKTSIFVISEESTSEVTDLYLIRRRSGDYLCETDDGNGRIWFFEIQRIVNAVNTEVSKNEIPAASGTGSGDLHSLERREKRGSMLER